MLYCIYAYINNKFNLSNNAHCCCGDGLIAALPRTSPGPEVRRLRGQCWVSQLGSAPARGGGGCSPQPGTAGHWGQGWEPA